MTQFIAYLYYYFDHFSEDENAFELAVNAARDSLDIDMERKLNVPKSLI